MKPLLTFILSLTFLSCFSQNYDYLQAYRRLTVSGTTVKGISNDTNILIASADSLVTQYAVKGFILKNFRTDTTKSNYNFNPDNFIIDGRNIDVRFPPQGEPLFLGSISSGITSYDTARWNQLLINEETYLSGIDFKDSGTITDPIRIKRYTDLQVDSAIEANKLYQVNADWNATSGSAAILNKPLIPLPFNPIAGTNVNITGSYPNLTFNSNGGGKFGIDDNTSIVGRAINMQNHSMFFNNTSVFSINGRTNIYYDYLETPEVDIGENGIVELHAEDATTRTIFQFPGVGGVQYVPVSVNGKLADATGNIQFSGNTGGSSPYHLPFNNDSTYYLSGDSSLHKLPVYTPFDSTFLSNKVNEKLNIIDTTSKWIAHGTHIPKEIILTTTGQQGASTLDTATGVLNIPNYFFAVDTTNNIDYSFSSMTTIYNEAGPGEYTISSSGVTTNKDNQNYPFRQLKALDIGGWSAGDYVSFKHATISNSTAYTFLRGFIRLKQAVPIVQSLSFQFFNNGSAISQALSVVNYGLDKSKAGIYQNITIPINAFGFTSNSFDEVRLIFGGGSSADGMYLDLFQFQNATVSENKYITDLFKKGLTDSVFKVLGGQNVFAFKDSAADFNTKTTTNLQEGSNLYFSKDRVFSAMSGLYESPLTFSSPLVRTVNTVSIPAASTSVNGYLTYANWNTFNNKQPAGNYLDSVRRNMGSLTVEGKINGTWRSLFIDSIGGGSVAGSNGEIQFNNFNLPGASSKFSWDNSNNKLLLGNSGTTNKSQIYSRFVSASDGIVFGAGNATHFAYLNPDGLFSAESIYSNGNITSNSGSFITSYTSPSIFNRSNSSSLSRMQFQTGGATEYYFGYRGGSNSVFYFDGNSSSSRFSFSGAGTNVLTGSSAINGALGTQNNTSALVTFESQAMGIMLPRMTITQRNAINLTIGTLTNFNITNAGSNYTSAPTISFSGGTGSGASATVGVSGGFVNLFTLAFSGGSGYTLGDIVTVTFSGGGASSQATATVKVGQVGTMIYNTTTDTIDFWNGTTWKSIVTN